MTNPNRAVQRSNQTKINKEVEQTSLWQCRELVEWGVAGQNVSACQWTPTVDDLNHT
jgi:hypothetical protein